MSGRGTRHIGAGLILLALLAGCGRDAPADNGTQPSAETHTIPDLAQPPAETGQEARDAQVPDASPTPAATAAVIPAAFRGRWGASRAKCGDGEEQALTITPALLRFYESEGRVKRVAPLGPRAISVRSRYSGEGESWENVQTLTLSESGEGLTIASMGTSAIRVKCS